MGYAIHRTRHVGAACLALLSPSIDTRAVAHRQLASRSCADEPSHNPLHTWAGRRMIKCNGEWRVIQDHPPCDVSGIALQSVEATPPEMTKLNSRPLVSFEVSASGIVSKTKRLRSSASSTLDEKALRLVASHHYPRHNCGACKMSMAVGVDFQGPVWVRELAVQTASVAH